jgi:hypothetical protein
MTSPLLSTASTSNSPRIRLHVRPSSRRLPHVFLIHHRPRRSPKSTCRQPLLQHLCRRLRHLHARHQPLPSTSPSHQQLFQTRSSPLSPLQRCRSPIQTSPRIRSSTSRLLRSCYRQPHHRRYCYRLPARSIAASSSSYQGDPVRHWQGSSSYLLQDDDDCRWGEEEGDALCSDPSCRPSDEGDRGCERQAHEEIFGCSAKVVLKGSFFSPFASLHKLFTRKRFSSLPQAYVRFCLSQTLYPSSRTLLYNSTDFPTYDRKCFASQTNHVY